MFFHMLSQIAFVKGSKPANITGKTALLTQMFGQNMGLKMGHNGEFGPTVPTGIPLQQFGHIMDLGAVENQTIRGTGFELAFITVEDFLSLFLPAFDMVLQFCLHVGLEITHVTSVFVFL